MKKALTEMAMTADEVDELVCFIDACINCGDGERHLLTDEHVKWSQRGDALCPDCGYERGVYSAFACCVSEGGE